MVVFKRLLWLVCTGLFSVNLFSQEMLAADSLVQAVQQQSNYSAQITLLRGHISKNYLTKYDETIQLSRFGYELASRQNDRVAKGDFLRLLGGAYGKKGNIDSASFYYYKALKELEQGVNNEKLGLLYDDMARLYRKLRQPKRALEFYDKALLIYEKENNLEGIARINNESGVVFRDEGDYVTANERFEKSLRIQQQRNDSAGIGYALEFLGYNQLLVKNYKQSENYLKQALQIREKLGDDFATMLNYTALGEYYKATKQQMLSNNYFEKSNAVAQKIKFLDIQRYNYEQIMDNHEALGNYEKAYQNLKAFNILNDSLYNVQKLKDVEEITTKYETAEKEKQILEQRAKITDHQLALKNRNFWIFGLTSLAVIIALLGFLLFKQQVLKNIKQEQDNKLKLALEKIETQNRLQEQRLAISRDLHDNIGAQLSFIVSAIDTIKYYLSGKNDQLTGRLDNIGIFAKETIQELRDTIWAMNKSGVAVKDLQSRIANFIEKARHSYPDTAISVNVAENIEDNLHFTALQGLNIFRIVQEATNNALKYANAGHIRIYIRKPENKIRFQIKDDGKGFIENNTEPGNGLLNMRKRALELGGELELSSEPGLGTEISFSIGDEKNKQ